jgi:hypothetical protein
MFREWEELKKLKAQLNPKCSVETLTLVHHDQTPLPIEAFSFGSKDQDAPVLGIVGGIHGLERIGSWVALAFLQYLNSRLDWDPSLNFQLERIRIFFVPLVNPIGMARFTRCNGNGVDLMRNAPINADRATFLVGGHHLSKHLPWYRGNPEQTFEGMEEEAKALLHYCETQIKSSRDSIILDLHSGFGIQDQLWYPYAKTTKIFPEIDRIQTLKDTLDRILPHHVYQFEPQSKNYTTHGDLWDYLYDSLKLKNPSFQGFLPLTLEMGSWNWVKKNPIQLLSYLGPYNPIKPHRQKRTLRRHLLLFDFLIRALTSQPQERLTR